MLVHHVLFTQTTNDRRNSSFKQFRSIEQMYECNLKFSWISLNWAKYAGSFQSSTKDRDQRAVKDASFHDHSALSTSSLPGRFAGLLRRRKRGNFCSRCLEYFFFFFFECRLRERESSLSPKDLCVAPRTANINLLTYSPGLSTKRYVQWIMTRQFRQRRDRSTSLKFDFIPRYTSLDAISMKGMLNFIVLLYLKF